MNDGANHLFTWKPGALQVVSATAITDQMIKNSILTDSEIAEGLILTCQDHPTSATIVVDYDDV